MLKESLCKSCAHVQNCLDAETELQVVVTSCTRYNSKPQMPGIAFSMLMLNVQGTESAVCADIANRQQFGIKKYGQTVANNPLTHEQWLQHAYEECLDMAVYLKRAMEELKKGKEDGTQATE